MSAKDTQIMTPSRRKMEQARAELDKAQDLFGKGKLDKAANVITALARQYPNYFAALYLAGMIFDRLGFPMEALTYLMRAHVVDARDRLTLEALGRLFTKMSDWQSAAWALEKAAEIGPADANLHVSLGDAWFANCEYERALSAYESAWEMERGSPKVAMGLAECCDYMGNSERARNVLESALSLRPGNPRLMVALARLPNRAETVDLLPLLQKTLASAPADANRGLVGNLRFAEASELHKRGRHEEAWKALKSANAERFDGLADKHRGYLRMIEVTGDDEKQMRASGRTVPAHRVDLPLYLMILGPPRSGKTVMESLLSSHRNITRGFENPIWQSIRRRVLLEHGFIDDAELMDMPPELHAPLRKAYEKELRDRSEGRSVLTSTNPAALFFLPRVMRMFPNLRVVFMRRNADDVAFRIFMKNIKDANTYAFNLEATRNHIGRSMQIAEATIADFPELCRMIDYEEMIENPEAAVNEVLSLCGLERADMKIPSISDDRNCSAPYRAWMNEN